MTTSGDRFPRQPDDREPLGEHAVSDDLDLVDETIANITDAEVEEQLRRVLDQSAPTPEQMWQGLQAGLPLGGLDACAPAAAAAIVASATKTAAEIVGAARRRVRLLEEQARVAQSSVVAARQEAERILADAHAEADTALHQAATMVRDAREQAARILGDAHAAEQIINAARRSGQRLAGGGGGGVVSGVALGAPDMHDWPGDAQGAVTVGVDIARCDSEERLIVLQVTVGDNARDAARPGATVLPGTAPADPDTTPHDDDALRRQERCGQSWDLARDAAASLFGHGLDYQSLIVPLAGERCSFTGAFTRDGGQEHEAVTTDALVGGNYVIDAVTQATLRVGELTASNPALAGPMGAIIAAFVAAAMEAMRSRSSEGPREIAAANGRQEASTGRRRCGQ